MNGSKINLHFFCADSTLGPGRRGAKSVIFFTAIFMKQVVI